jgi:formate dehydrogenase subunit delta
MNFGEGHEIMQGNKLVTMINQIADFHRRQPTEAAAAEVARHLERFWEPRMRVSIYAHLDAGGAGLSEVSRQAVSLMKARDAGKLAFDPGMDAKLTPPLEA